MSATAAMSAAVRRSVRAASNTSELKAVQDLPEDAVLGHLEGERHDARDAQVDDVSGGADIALPDELGRHGHAELAPVRHLELLREKERGVPDIRGFEEALDGPGVGGVGGHSVFLPCGDFTSSGWGSGFDAFIASSLRNAQSQRRPCGPVWMATWSWSSFTAPATDSMFGGIPE